VFWGNPVTENGIDFYSLNKLTKKFEYLELSQSFFFKHRKIVTIFSWWETHESYIFHIARVVLATVSQKHPPKEHR
jgi:hypothetical protein